LVKRGDPSWPVTLTLRSASGTASGAATLSLGSSQQTARFISELFPGVGDFEGTLEITAPRSLAALALRQNLASGIFSTVPVSPSPTEMFFSPRAGTSARIVQEIQQTQKTIDVAIYSFTSDDIADALVEAMGSGVEF